MINKAASGVGFSRKYDYRRHKLTIGYTLFFAGIFLLASLAVAKLVAGANRLLPAFINTTVVGQLYIYNLIAFSLIAITLMVDSRMLIFDGIPTNRWNLFFKSGIAPGKLIFNKLFFSIGAVLRVYLIGAVGAFALGFLFKSGESAAGLVDWILAVVLGVCMLLVLILPAIFFGSFVYKRLAVSGVVLVTAVGVFLLLYVGGYLAARDEAGAIAAIRSLVMPAPTAISVIAFGCLVLFSVGAYLFASSRIRNYEIEELDDEELMRLGVTRDIVIYERDEDDYEVAISGPELFEAEDNLPEPTFEHGETADGDRKKKRDKKEKPKKEKKSKRSRDEDDE